MIMYPFFYTLFTSATTFSYVSSLAGVIMFASCFVVVVVGFYDCIHCVFVDR